MIFQRAHLWLMVALPAMRHSLKIVRCATSASLHLAAARLSLPPFRAAGGRAASGACTLVTLAVLVASSLAGCSGPAARPDAADDAQDAARDASVDAKVDAGPCGADRFFTGDFVDWDSDEVNFKGIFDASFTVVGAPTRTDKTSPNGRFELCVANAAETRVTVDAPGTGEMAYLDGTLVITDAAMAAASSTIGISLRSMRRSRAQTFFAEQQIAGGFAADRGHLLVAIDGGAATVSLDRVAPAVARSGATWAAGTTGQWVFFANLDPAQNTVTVSAPGTVGATTVPVVAGQLTMLALVKS